MPMYDWFCPKCNMSMTTYRSVSDRDRKAVCPHCGDSMDRVMFPQDSSKPEGRNDLRDPFRKI